METQAILRPTTAEQLREIVAEAGATGRALEARGGGSKREIGAPGRATQVVELGALSGVIDYEPSELVLTALPATPLVEIEALLAARGQMLAFEPWDHGPLFGRPAGAATIGGVVAAGVAGPRRVSAGSARDHLLGFTAVSGRGEAFKGGGKVVKNVTGYDTAKVIAGSWGQLAIMTELTLKVVPRPRATTTVALRGLSASAAIVAAAKALGSRCSPAAAAHFSPTAQTPAVTAIRLEGFRESVDLRAMQLRDVLVDFADAVPLDEDEAEDLWASAREVRPLAAAEALWRVHVAPSRAAALTDALERLDAQWFADWAGALVWVGAPASADVRTPVEGLGGHAMLLRGPSDLLRAIPIRHPDPSGVAALSARVKQAFDPAGVLDPARFS
ncbi:MAG TPA: FAD-binding protein [Novosphingobium sp.]